MCHPLLNDILLKLDHLINTLNQVRKEAQPYLSIEDAACYLRMSESNLYKHTSGRKIPHYKPNGKLIVFNKKDLDAWIEQKRILTDIEILNPKKQ